MDPRKQVNGFSNWHAPADQQRVNPHAGLFGGGGGDFDVNAAAGMLDDKITKNILGDLKKHMPPGGFPKHKPLLVPTAAAAQQPAKAKPAGPSGDLLTTMSQRLAQLEGLNKSLRSEHHEKAARLV